MPLDPSASGAWVVKQNVHKLDHIIQCLLVPPGQDILGAMIAGVRVQEFINMTNRLESRGKLLVFLGKNAVTRQPILEAQICHGFRKSRSNTAQQYRYSARFHIVQEMVETLQ